MKEDPSNQKTLCFIENMFLATKNWKCVNEIPKTCKKLWPIGKIRAQCLGCLTAVRPHICNIEAANYSAGMKSGCHWQFREKTLLTWIFSFRKIVPAEILVQNISQHFSHKRVKRCKATLNLMYTPFSNERLRHHPLVFGTRTRRQWLSMSSKQMLPMREISSFP